MALFGAIGCYLRDRFLGQQCGTETESTTMFEAIDSGDARTVSMLLDARPTLLEKKVSIGGVYVHRLCSSDELTPLMYAARADELGLVKLLLRRGAKINAESFFSQTALHFAAESGHAGVVAYLLYSGAQPRNHSPTPLMYASMKGHGRVVPLLLEHMGGQGLETRDGYGFTALHWAARQGHVEVVVHLLRHGAQADTRDNKGGTALSIAVSRGHVEAVKLLVGQLGPHALHERDQRGKSLLHVAVKCVKEDMMAYLLDNGLRPTTTDNNGMTGLMCGAQSTRAWVIPKLIKYTGRDGLDMRDATEGRTALHWAVYSGRAESVRALLAAGADTSIVDNQGRTPRSYTEKGYFLDSASAFKWWDRELERGFLLYRAKVLHDAYTTHQQAIAFPVPAYLKARMRTGLALPRVEVEARQGEGTGGEGAGNGEAPGEKDAILEWAVEELNTELFTEMVHYFPAPRD